MLGLQPSANLLEPRWATLALLLAWTTWAPLVSAQAGGTAELRTGQPQRARLAPGQRRTHRLSLAQRDCALGSLRAAAQAVELRVLDPSGKRVLRRFGGTHAVGARAEPARELEFCIEAAGDYRLELSLDKRARQPAEYELTLDAILGRTTSLVPLTAARQPVRSPRLLELQAALHHSQTDADVTAVIAKFWHSVERTGTPLVEPLDGDQALVTFLYRARPPRRPVSISWRMWSGVFELTELEPLAGSDVLWLSVPLPKAARLSYQLVIDPPRDPNPGQPNADRAERAVARADPRNPHVLPESSGLDAFELRSVLELPDAPKETWLHARPAPVRGRGRGRMEHQALHSQRLGNDHALSVYVPAPAAARAGAAPAPPYPLLIVFDGETYLESMQMPRLLDDLIATRAIAPLIAVFVHNRTAHSRDDELPCNPRFADFVAGELVPHVQAHYPVAPEPKRTGLLGSSFGGLASSYIALLHPERFGKVLSQSGSFWWSFARGHAAFDGDERPGWLRRRFESRPPVPVEFYLSAGAFETESSSGGVLEHTRLQRDALRARGYQVAYQEFVGGHDVLAWRASLADALRAMFPPGT